MDLEMAQLAKVVDSATLLVQERIKVIRRNNLESVFLYDNMIFRKTYVILVTNCSKERVFEVEKNKE
jgi:hypothetical protein